MGEPTSMSVMMPKLEADRVAIELHSKEPSPDDEKNATYLDNFVDLRPNRRGHIKANGLYILGRTLFNDGETDTLDTLEGKYIAIRHVENDFVLGTCLIQVEYFDDDDDE